MPLYDYRCRTCGASLEALEPLGAPEARPCACGEPEGLRRVVSVTAVVFKGGGWYAQGYGAPTA